VRQAVRATLQKAHRFDPIPICLVNNLRGGVRMRSTVIAASAVAFTIALLAGCASTSTSQPATETASSSTSTPATSSAIGNTGNASSKAVDSQTPKLLVRFEFDSSVLDDANRKIVEDNAKYLMSHPNAKIRIEGHADERGTREYNLALGERRAQTVAK